MIRMLELYYEELDKEHKRIKDKYRKEKPGRGGFTYDRNKQWDESDGKRLKNIKQQKLAVNKLIKLMKEE